MGAMAIKRYSEFPKAPILLEPHHQIVQRHIQEGVLALYREAIGVFYSLSWLGHYFSLPIIETESPELARMKYFAKIDLKFTYSQIKIDDNFKEITTINTSIALLR